MKKKKEEDDSPALMHFDASIRGFDYYITKSKERLITATRNSTDNIKQ